MIVAGAGWWATRPPLVRVNFISYPFDATIYLDGNLLVAANGEAFATPCTVDGLPAQPHEVVFKQEPLDDLGLGQIDFARSRQIVGHWPSEP